MTESNSSSATGALPKTSWRQLIEAIRIVGTTLRLAWVSFVLTIVGGLLFVVPDQSQDVIRATLIDIGDWRWKEIINHWPWEQASGEWPWAHPIHLMFFVGALALWALGAQIWARIMTMHPRAPRKFRAGCDMETAADCVEAMPRLLGFSVFITIAMAVCCIVLETPLLVYWLVAVPFLPVLLTLVIVLNPRQTRKRVLVRMVAAFAAIAYLCLLAYLLLQKEWGVTTVVWLLVVPLVLILAGTCLKLDMPERVESRALKLTCVFFIPLFLTLAFAMEFSFQLEVANFERKCKQDEYCKYKLNDMRLSAFDNTSMRFLMAQEK